MAGGAKRMFTKAEAAAIVGEALAIVDELDPPADLRVEAFRAALNVIGQHEVRPSPLAQGFGGMTLPR